MGAMKDGLKQLARVHQLEAELKRMRTERAHLYDRLDAQVQLRVAAEDQAMLVAGRLVQMEEFIGWLMEQDASSAEIFSPSKKRKKIEGKNDLELALMFIEE
jgi:hypothetical protein